MPEFSMAAIFAHLENMTAIMTRPGPGAGDGSMDSVLQELGDNLGVNLMAL
jgi:hypothetical protein